jgi:hypothetical protein
MYAIRKSDLKKFTPNAKSVCRIEDGSTNSYLRNDREIEDFLLGIEPRYNAILEKLRSGKMDCECVYVVAGFIAYVIACSPTAARLGSEPLKHIFEETGRRLDRRGAIPKVPPSLGGKSFTELVQSGIVEASVDPKFPQAIGITSISSYVNTLGNFSWEILLNHIDGNPFFTSDFPIAAETTADRRIFNKIVPLAPDIAIRMRPDFAAARENANFSFSNFRWRVVKLGRSECMEINRLIVRCAETTVFFPQDLDWIAGFVRKNAGFRIEPRTHIIHERKRTFFWMPQEVSGSRSDGHAAPLPAGVQGIRLL